MKDNLRTMIVQSNNYELDFLTEPLENENQNYSKNYSKQNSATR